MKRLLLILLLVCFSCDSSSDDSGPNSAPSIPKLIYPTDNLFCIDNTIQFLFRNANDEDGDSITYDIEFSNDSSFSQDVLVYNSSVVTNTYTLDKGLVYYWRVKAIDNRGLSGAYSDIFSFFTQSEGQVNSLPYVPTLIIPELNDTVEANNVNLQWNAIDIDDDELVYDVYLGTVSPPVTLVLENYQASSWMTDLNVSETYYWRVVVKDINSGNTLGQIWKFRTN